MTTPLYLLQLTRSQLRERLLRYFFAHLEASLYLREAASLLDVDPANLSRELRVLEQEGIFRSELRGHQKFFWLNSSHPLFHELKSLVEKVRPAASAAHRASPVSEQGGAKGSHAKQARQLYIIAGPNGAGKTTFAKTFLPDFAGCEQFINADLIANGLSPLRPDAAQLEAGRLLLTKIDECAARKINFSFETTLAGRRYLRLLKRLRGDGYVVHVIYLWVPNVELAMSRVRERVARGGHNIPDKVIRRRFLRGLTNLFGMYQTAVDDVTVFDNSGAFPHLIAATKENELRVLDEKLFRKMKKQTGDST